MAEQKKTPNKKTKPINKKEKFIWFLISMVIFAVGAILAKCGVSFDNYAVKAVYAVLVLFPLLMAAQKVSYERFDENGKRNIPAFLMYYACVLLFIVLIPVIFWVNQFVQIG
ncbi:MAG: hypothetical protein IJZ57_05280 [Clostridia bacterium]|nr:hypothetical protein [Clostridia bacterium]